MDNRFTQELLEKVSSRAEATIKEVIEGTLKEELYKSLSKSLMESEFYRSISDDLRAGLSNVYKEISSAKNIGSMPVSEQEANELFSEASDQLDEILQSTEKATVDIMEIVEKNLDTQIETESILKELEQEQDIPENTKKLRGINDKLNEDLISIMTTLSFQDLTGQRIKRIIEALRKVEHIVFDLYISTGLSMKAKEQQPEKNVQEIKKETQQKVSDLKGPQTEASQADVDDLLAQLGM